MNLIPVKKEKTNYALDTNRINILLMGTSGAGKSTLINALIPEANAPVGSGKAVTREMKPYAFANGPVTLIDSVGYEYNLLRQLGMQNQIRKCSKSGHQNGDSSKLIHHYWQGYHIQPADWLWRNCHSSYNVFVVVKYFSARED